MKLLKSILTFIGVYFVIAIILIVIVFAPCYLAILWFGAANALIAMFLILMLLILGAMILTFLIFM